MSDDGIPSPDGHGDDNLGHVTSRRNVLKGAAALGAAAAGLPAAKRLGAQPARPAGSARADQPPTLWNGQQVTQPIGLSSKGTPRRGGDLTWAWIFTPIAQMDPQMPTTGDNGDLGTLLWIYDQLTNITPAAGDHHNEAQMQMIER